ncbi:MAG: Rne/Rng family ribonuclease, partial [Cyclobacteriaceae bacterium]|nr:Rne/Rng family ribonuclease [Cyclobacteriaceae bacterium]
MSNELIINSTQNGCRIALLKDKNLIEYHEDSGGERFMVGDIYLGTIKKIVPGLNAAFIDIGHEKDAFLHYLDLGPQFNTLQKFAILAQRGKFNGAKLDKFRNEPDISKHGKMTQVTSKGNKILVQVTKEPISTKGPRLSCELSLAGRYLILVPFGKGINISKKITKVEERKRLQRLITSIKPENFGIIIRTVAEGKDVASLDADLRQLYSKWEEGVNRLKGAKPRAKVIGEMSVTSALLRDVLNESYDNIYVDDKEIHDEVKAYIKTIAPDKEKIIRAYQNKVKIFENFGIEKQLKLAFGKSVSIKGGGYLIIEHTEALHVIDVNSGNKSSKEEDQEGTALSVNIEAAKEIARQLRLRDMGGIIVVDFIDLRKAENKKKVYDVMKEEMKEDRSKFTVLPLSKFGLMQITRQRVRPEMNIKTREVCPACEGTGKVTATILVSDQIEANI